MGLIQVEDVLLLVGQDVVGEPGVELGQLLFDLGVALLGRPFESRAVSGELVVGELHQALLVRPQARRLQVFVHRGDALEQLAVLDDLRFPFRQPAGQRALELPKLRGGQVGTPNAVVDQDPLEGVPRPLQGLQGVLEGGGLRVGGDGLDLPQVLGDGRFQGRLQVRQVHPVEGGNASVGAGPLLKQRVLSFGFSGHRVSVHRRDGLGNGPRTGRSQSEHGGQGNGGDESIHGLVPRVGRGSSSQIVNTAPGLKLPEPVPRRGNQEVISTCSSSVS